MIASVLILHLSGIGLLHAQTEQPAATETTATEAFNTEQLDALLAPIALYPDDLLTQVLMAATFPLEVVQAGRWLEQPGNKDLKGDALEKALQAQKWDPSVKSIVPFPEVVALMNDNLDWTQQLGYAFADQQTAVFDSVQRLRRQAQGAGNLQSSPQQVVREENATIIIQPAETNTVYVPSYNPTTVYGTWPYPSYPPVYLPPPTGYAFGAALATGMAFAAGAAVVGGLWGWASPSWGGGYADVNVNRYNNINVNGQKISSSQWKANRQNGRPAGFTRPPNGPVGRPTRGNGLPTNAVGRDKVSVPKSAVNLPARSGGAAGNRAGAGAGANRPAAGAGAKRPAAGAGAGNRTPRASQPIASKRAGGAAGAKRAAAGGQRSTALSGLSQGRQAGQAGQRGAQSRSMSQRQRPSGGARAGGARAGGGGARAGGGARGGGRGRR